MRKPIKLTFAKAAVLTGLGFLAGVNFDKLTTPPTQYKAGNLLTRVFNEAVNRHISHPDPEKLALVGIDAMLGSLDPHSSYIPEVNNFMQSAKPYRGLGIAIEKTDGGVLIRDVYENTPAARVGLKAGDIITAINEQDTASLTMEGVTKLLSADSNNAITLRVERRGADKPLEFSPVSEVISVSPVTSKVLAGNIGYVRLRSFNEKAATDVQASFTALTQQLETSAAGYILDLRGNPGGYVDEAVKIADLFLHDGTITSIADGKNIKYSYKAEKGDILNGKPLIVLVDGGSASASELVSGALQDRRRAEITGTATFGKGTMQKIFDLSTLNLFTLIEFGPEGSLRLTTNHYLTPSGASIQGRGITPDTRYNDPSATADSRHESDLPNALANPDFVESTAATRETFQPRPGVTANTVGPDYLTPYGEPDFILLGAIDKLTGTSEFTLRAPAGPQHLRSDFSNSRPAAP